MMKPKLAIVLTHPVQYYAPLFEQLSQRRAIDIKVFYTLGPPADHIRFDKGFGRNVEWDIPLLEGYAYEFLTNTSRNPGNHLRGIVNPDAITRIRDYDPTAIMIFGWPFISHLRIMRYFKGRIPVIFRGDSTLLDEQGGLRSVVRYWMLRWVYSHVDLALYVGKNNYDYYLKFGLRPRQLIHAPHAIDNKRFMKDDSGQQQQALVLRKSLNIQEGDFVFLFAGKLEPKKDPFTLLAAFTSGNFPHSVHLVFTGNGELEAALRLKARSSSNVHFLPFQNQQAMPSLYRMTDVFVLPSRGPEETWGLAVNEAMACGSPVIVSRKCGCAPDLVANGENGYIFREEDVQDLLDKMQAMYQNRRNLASFRKASLARIQQYSIEAVCQSVEDLTGSLYKASLPEAL